MQGAEAGKRRRHLVADRVRTVALSGLVLLTSACGQPAQIDGAMGHSAAATFDPRTTALTLQKTDAGGVETVVARDGGDAAQVGQVHMRLQQEVAQFQQGRYQDPAREHGMVMPGSRELEAGYTKVQVAYTELPMGGQIDYTASDPGLVDALHAWFDRRELAR